MHARRLNEHLALASQQLNAAEGTDGANPPVVVRRINDWRCMATWPQAFGLHAEANVSSPLFTAWKDHYNKLVCIHLMLLSRGHRLQPRHLHDSLQVI